MPEHTVKGLKSRADVEAVIERRMEKTQSWLKSAESAIVEANLSDGPVPRSKVVTAARARGAVTVLEALRLDLKEA